MPVILTLSAVPKTADKAKEVLEKIQNGEVIPHPDFHTRVMGLLEYVASGAAEAELEQVDSASCHVDLEISKAATLVREAIEYLTQKELDLFKLAISSTYAHNMLSAKRELYQVLSQLERSTEDIPF